MGGRATTVALCGGSAVVGGLLAGWPELIAIGTALLMLLVVPRVLRGPPTATWWDESAPVRVVRGDPAALALGIHVPSGGTTWVSAVDDTGGDRAWVPDSKAPVSLIWPIDTSRRGLIPVGPSRLEWSDPLGLARRVLAERDPSRVLVVPRVHPVEARTSLATRQSGESAERSGSEQFHSLREYVVGDPMKLVHWRSSARAGKLMVRRMVDTTVPWLLVVLDVNCRAYDRAGAIFEDFDSEAFERSVDTAASWAWWGCGPDQRVLLTTTADDASSVEVTARTRDSALDWLALVSPTSDRSCGPARVQALARRRGVGRLVFVTGSAAATPTASSAGWVSNWGRALPVSVIIGHQ